MTTEIFEPPDSLNDEMTLLELIMTFESTSSYHN